MSLAITVITVFLLFLFKASKAVSTSDEGQERKGTIEHHYVYILIKQQLIWWAYVELIIEY